MTTIDRKFDDQQKLNDAAIEDKVNKLVTAKIAAQSDELNKLRTEAENNKAMLEATLAALNRTHAAPQNPATGQRT